MRTKEKQPKKMRGRQKKRLIDADALIKIFDLGSKNGYVFVNFKDIVEIIKKQPEAYKADIVTMRAANIANISMNAGMEI